MSPRSSNTSARLAARRDACLAASAEALTPGGRAHETTPTVRPGEAAKAEHEESERRRLGDRCDDLRSGELPVIRIAERVGQLEHRGEDLVGKTWRRNEADDCEQGQYVAGKGLPLGVLRAECVARMAEELPAGNRNGFVLSGGGREG